MNPNHTVLFVILIMLILTFTSGMTVVRAARRINALYKYFIVDRNKPTGKLGEALKGFNESRTDDTIKPDPNDGSGCPKEKDLVDGD